MDIGVEQGFSKKTIPSLGLRYGKIPRIETQRRMLSVDDAFSIRCSKMAVGANGNGPEMCRIDYPPAQ